MIQRLEVEDERRVACALVQLSTYEDVDATPRTGVLRVSTLMRQTSCVHTHVSTSMLQPSYAKPRGSHLISCFNFH